MFRSTSLAFFTSGSSTRTESASAERVSSCDGVGISQPMTWQRGRSLGGIFYLTASGHHRHLARDEANGRGRVGRDFHKQTVYWTHFPPGGFTLRPCSSVDRASDSYSTLAVVEPSDGHGFDPHLGYFCFALSDADQVERFRLT